MSNPYDVIVIGAGMMGAAAARHLAQAGARVCIIGPDEPADYAAHDGVFASHYDEGRLSYRLSKDLVWARLTARAVEHYPIIEAESGVAFHGAVGGLMVARDMVNYAFTSHRHEIAREHGVPFREYGDAQAIHEAHPMFGFPVGYGGLFELPPAGWVNPRALVRAQLAIARKRGAAHIRDVAVRARRADGSVEVLVRGGDAYLADRVVLAGGAFSNCFDLLPGKLALRIKTETIILAEVDAGEAGRLKDMPVALYDIESDHINGIYMTPPMRYPDGGLYIKMGCDTSADEWPADLAAMQAWMRRGREDGMRDVMLRALLSFMPGLRVRSCRAVPCLVTYTPHRKPFIDQIDDGVFVATGGNGSSAKCSDTLGWLAAELALARPWPGGFNRADFRVVTH